ncbi:MAG TPA: (Fe-S)-binding protein [Tenuifilaceae bacterium]|nr:(Fe-S)-binding protein [Tenuifilaceae bacterium]
MMNYHPFVIPFTVGALFLFGVVFYKFYAWIAALDRKQKFMVKQNIFSFKTIRAIGEIFREALVHRNIYRKNPVLGYMHMSLAFGWFLLIVVGKIKASLYAGTFFEPPWLGIFFNFFAVDGHAFSHSEMLTFTMDFLLLIILSGLALAIIKRVKSSLLGMRKTTKHSRFDRIALSSLWFIFPLRLMAESTTASLHGNGGFLTNSVGHLIPSTIAPYAELPLWWAYSISLFVFFVALPYSRYMHIPTEVVLIFLRNWGADTGEQLSGYTDIQLNSCSRCGICIDACQLNFAAGISNVQSVYFVRDARYKTLSDEVVNNCLMCGRCSNECPVGLELTLVRQQFRNKQEIPGKFYYEYTEPVESKAGVDVIYYAGCMTHLTPSIIISMKKIFEAAGVNYWFMDEDKGVCCGRPLRQQGFIQQSKNLVIKNSRIINSARAKLLVTSCPICYKSFREEYNLNLPVMHHTEYIEGLLADGRITLNASNVTVVYHDPCELGRGANIYEQPRNILRNFSLIESDYEKENSLCCGGSLSDAILDLRLQLKIRDHALGELTKDKPEVLVTACPLCKKSFVHGNKARVMDIAEIVAGNLKVIASKKRPVRKEELQLV